MPSFSFWNSESVLVFNSKSVNFNGQTSYNTYFIAIKRKKLIIQSVTVNFCYLYAQHNKTVKIVPIIAYRVLRKYPLLPSLIRKMATDILETVDIAQNFEPRYVIQKKKKQKFLSCSYEYFLSYRIYLVGNERCDRSGEIKHERHIFFSRISTTYRMMSVVYYHISTVDRK